MSLSAKEFLARAVRTELVTLDDGAQVRVREMTAGERMKVAELFAGGATRARVACETVVTCSIDDDGKRLFSEDDVGKLEEASARDIFAIAEVVSRLSGVTKAKTPEGEQPAGESSAQTSASSSD